MSCPDVVDPNNIQQTDLAAFRPGLENPGLKPVQWDDGTFEAGEISDVKIVRAVGLQLYFAVDDRFCVDIPEDTTDRYVITAQVYDGGKGNLQVQYDGYARPGQSAFGSQWVKSRTIRTAGKKDWITVTFELTRPRLANRQQGVADFRFVGSSRNKPQVRRVELRRIKATNE